MANWIDTDIIIAGPSPTHAAVRAANPAQDETGIAGSRRIVRHWLDDSEWGLLGVTISDNAAAYPLLEFDSEDAPESLYFGCVSYDMQAPRAWATLVARDELIDRAWWAPKDSDDFVQACDAGAGWATAQIQRYIGQIVISKANAPENPIGTG